MLKFVPCSVFVHFWGWWGYGGVKKLVIFCARLTEIFLQSFITAIHLQKLLRGSIVCTPPPPPPPFCWRGGVEPLTNLSKNWEGLTGSRFLERDCWERGGWFFSGGCTFYIKNKLKSQIFNDKKSSLAKMFFSVTTKNLNWKILTKNWVTFKKWDEIKNDNCNWKIQFLGGVHQKPMVEVFPTFFTTSKVC